MSVKFHEGLEDMNKGPFVWEDASLDFRVAVLKTDWGPLAADTWAVDGIAELQDTTHISAKIPTATHVTDDEGLIGINAAFTFTPNSQAIKVNPVFIRFFGPPDTDAILYFHYADGEDVGGLVPFLCQGNIVTVNYLTGIYQF